MLEVGWTEMLVIAIVMIVVVGPKDLPKMLRTFGKTAAKLRSMAGDFQKQFNEALREAELDDVKKSVQDLKGLNPANEIRKHINPFEKAANEVRAGLDKAMNPTNPTVGTIPRPDPAPVAQAAEPLKNGATAMPEALQGATNGAASAAPAAQAAAIATPATASTAAAVAGVQVAAAEAATPKAKPAAKTTTKAATVAKAPAKTAGGKPVAGTAGAAKPAPKAQAAKPAPAKAAATKAAAPRKKTGPAS